jgi:hypothetical protein
MICIVNEVWGLFKAKIQHQEQLAEMPNRELQGLIPDFKFQLAAQQG